ncbi:CIC11C00000005420 [Sungouiella intermedia]|uniref:CIC11C00000005420 n=1 Tax=Sungouiella intermedia TaxID=45354 RepID=A0A1L0FRJ0_9ASCO|nr:CIC11C00000005420 [[Candida] intermedia]
MTDYNDEDDSLPSSPQDTEPSPRYIMMLRRELASSPLSPNQLRKQAHLSDRAANLKRKNEDVKQKVLEVRRRQEALESMAASQMVVQFAQANERRRRHLEQIRERARALRSYWRRKREDLFDLPGVPYPSEYSRFVSFDNGELAPDNDSSVDDEKKYTSIQISAARTIQRAIRKKILEKALSDRTAQSLVNSVMDFKLSYSQAIALLTGRQSKYISNLLKALGLPYTANVNGYVWFLYSIALISDFQEFTEKETASHPGFNVNINNKKRNTLTSVLPIVLYRYATRIFYELRRIQNMPLEKVKLAICLPRLTLARYWREYHYFFVLFKFNHAQAMKDIAEEALDIAATQQRIMRSLEGKEERSFRDRIHLFGNFNQLLSFSKYKSVSWAEIGDKRRLSKEILSIASHLDKLNERGRNEPELLYDASLITDDNHLNLVVTISRGEVNFAIPPDVAISSWRQFFFEYYQQKLLDISQSRCPSSMRSGSRSVPQTQSGFSMSEVLKLSAIKQLSFAEGESFLSRCDRKLRHIFNRYYAYCQHIGDADDLHDTWKNYDQLCSLYILSEIKTVEIGQAQSYFKLFMLLLMQLLNFASVDDSAALEFVVEIEKSIDNLLVNFDFLYQNLEASLNAKWVSHCVIRDVDSFITFENFYQMAGSNCYRDNLNTNFPQLRFSQFYQFVFMNSKSKCNARLAALMIIGGTKSRPRQLSINERALRFFSIVIVNFLSSDLHFAAKQKFEYHHVDEISLLTLMQSQLKTLTSTFRDLFLLSCLASMLHLSKKQAFTLRSLAENYDDVWSIQHLSGMQKHLSDFQWKYMVQALLQLSERKLKVFDIFTTKLRDALMSTGGPQDFFDKNFPYFAGEWRDIHGNIGNMCTVFYVLYRPILNWIYSDLGCPIE